MKMKQNLAPWLNNCDSGSTDTVEVAAAASPPKTQQTSSRLGKVQEDAVSEGDPDVTADEKEAPTVTSVQQVPCGPVPLVEHISIVPPWTQQLKLRLPVVCLPCIREPHDRKSTLCAFSRSVKCSERSSSCPDVWRSC